jgi:hypothetical protein
VCKFGEHTAHGFFAQARICIHNFGDAHPRSERFEDKRHRNAGVAHTRAATEVLRISNDPPFHKMSLAKSAM